MMIEVRGTLSRTPLACFARWPGGRVCLRTFRKKFDKNFIKNRATRDFLIIFAPLFLKSGWGSGGKAPKIIYSAHRATRARFLQRRRIRVLRLAEQAPPLRESNEVFQQ